VLGQTLGSYPVVAKLGEGGMGEVYRARDIRLLRDVAIKILPPHFAADGDRLARLTREAQTLAALNHPNIAAIYGIEEADGIRALVMELVDGDDLSQIIARGAMPVADTLPIAKQIADALEAAHEQGIIHRDLKPANIKVRADGLVKVLDFGLAKALAPAEGASAAADAMHSPTLTARATQMGTILGTAAYMAPEQARGKAVDKRADIWAFGVVLYEMLTGRRPFDGEDVSIALASVLKDDIDWRALPPELPAPLRRVLRRCLEKDPRRRLSSISDARLELDETTVADPDGAAARASVATPVAPIWRRAVPFVATAIASALVVIALMMLRRPAAPAPEIVRFKAVQEAASTVYGTSGSADFAVSHDGRTLVYPVSNLGSPQLRLRRLEQLTPVPITGGGSAFGPFFSADDQWIGFFDLSLTIMRKVPISGGVPFDVVHAKSQMLGATWLSDGTIIYSQSGSGLFAVPEGGGQPKKLTTLDPAQGETQHQWPWAIPGTNAVLFVTVSGDPRISAHVAVLDRASGRVTRTSINGTFPRYLPTGHLIYAQPDGALMATAFDVSRLAITGTPAPVGERVGMKSSGLASFDVANDGRLVFSSYSSLGDRGLAWVDRTGRESAVAAPPRSYFYARVSPDGTRLSFDIRDQDQDIWMWDARGALSA
jgi:hypothetical protein